MAEAHAGRFGAWDRRQVLVDKRRGMVAVPMKASKEA